MDKQDIVAWGREEAAWANQLFDRQEEAVQEIQARYAKRLQHCHGVLSGSIVVHRQPDAVKIRCYDFHVERD